MVVLSSNQPLDQPTLHHTPSNQTCIDTLPDTMVAALCASPLALSSHKRRLTSSRCAGHPISGCLHWTTSHLPVAAAARQL